MLTLYHSLASTCSKKVRMCLFEKDLAFESRVLNLQKFEQHDPAYLKLNPKGVVPTLVDDGKPVCESSRIIEYIDRQFPDPPLSPGDEAGQVRQNKWITWSDEVGYAAVYIPTWDVLSRPVASRMADGELARALARIPTAERRDRWNTVARDGFSQGEFDDAYAKMTATFTAMENELADGPWLAGKGFSLGDIAMIPFVERIDDLRADLLASGEFSRVADWLVRMKGRLSFDKTFFFNGVDARTGAIHQAQIDAGLIPG